MLDGKHRERRRRRSDDTAIALGYWLQELSTVRGARAAAIGTRDGLPIATAGVDIEPELLASAGSMAAEGKLTRARAVVPDIDANTVDVYGADELVVSLCGAPAPRDAEVGSHIRRIIGGA